MKLTEYSPTNDLVASAETVVLALAEALIDGDKEAFQEILEGHAKARQISKVLKKNEN